VGEEYNRRQAISVRLNITTEGQTEERFINDILCPHLAQFNVFTSVRRLRTSKTHRGGYTNFERAKFDIAQWLKEDATAWHTTLIDLYGLKDDFPGYKNAKHLLDAMQKVNAIEQAFSQEIAHHRFIPYIQLHEFEALLFSAPDIMEKWCSLDSYLPLNCFGAIRQQFATPELINDSPITAPSKRILSLHPGYNKVIDAKLIAEEIGLAKIREECPHFNNWLSKLEGLK